MKTRDGLEKLEDPRTDTEYFWVSHYTYLAENGYQLRPRYRPGWVPSWLGAPGPLRLSTFEDWHLPIPSPIVIDAIRIEDGFAVALKRVPVATQELSALRFLSLDPVTQSPLNHTVPLLQVLPVPGDSEAITVMPKLREFMWPYFHCRREVLECLRQIIEGVGFMHSLGICHGDACTYNFMMDATEVCPRGFHYAFPQSIDGTGDNLVTKPRCQCQVRYYIIDFETSQQFSCDRDYALRQVDDTRCDIPFSPELAEANIIAKVPYNPFRLDVFNIGATFQLICEDYFGQLDELQPFLGWLAAQEPSARPRLEDAMKELLVFIASRSEEWLDFPTTRIYLCSVTGKRYENSTQFEKILDHYTTTRNSS
ncbi:hypothetical protein CPB85DRAFT_1320768 [Mucidula mucida]|nr:hypothetical protein CPB85DRAFT_1320768 [Mucidula mucida]